MKIGLYFGSFNPIHVGHLIIAKHILNEKFVDQIWFVLSPQNPLKQRSTLLNEYHRQHLIQMCLEGESQMKCSTVEFKLPKPSYTIDTLVHLEEKYANHSWQVILGSDSLHNINNWKNSQKLLGEYDFLVYKRPGFTKSLFQQDNIKVLDAPLLDISSSHIRKLIKTDKSIRYYVTDAVYEEITSNNYYK
ncbi:MAG: nicotinate (nicotinamide) nucleotide adenylyltransferase [Ginsengibacter sp.]